jgi:dihydroorotate dehydrogenase
MAWHNGSVDLYKSVLRPLLFKVDPETVHEWALGMATKGLIKEHRPVEYTALEQEFLGGTFKNPLGLAAGFDKNAVALGQWEAQGFGFVEIGTVTYQRQDGNPKPRLFRLPDDQALINRLGFNNIGAEAVAQNIANNRCEIPFGINIGKSYTTPIEKAAEDYKKSFEAFRGFGNYFVVNVSSPNTPGLRSLQEKDKLTEVLKAIRDVAPVVPLFVKVAPDLELTAVDDVIEVALEMRLTGLIATNTTTSRAGLATHTHEAGGLSGRPLRRPSEVILAHIARNSEERLMVIGVGGIFNGEDLYRKISLGAHLCQVYTGWVYGGPNMVPDTLAEMVALMEQRGFKDLKALRGTGLTQL